MTDFTSSENRRVRKQAGSYGRDFLLYAIGQAISVVGDRIALIALVFLVVHLSRAYPPALALFYVCRVAPSLLGGLLAGLLVDHFNRRRLMIWCDIGRALLLAAVPLLSSFGLSAIYPLVFMVYGLTMLFEAAAGAALPDVVPEAKLTDANAVLQAISAFGDLAYALGGGLVVVLKLQLPFYIDAATFLFSALMLAAMRLPQVRIGLPMRLNEILPRLRQGFDYLVGTPFLKWSTLTFTLAPIAGGAIFVVVPLYAQHALAHSPGLVGPLRSGAFRFGILEAALGFGVLGGSVLASLLARRWSRGVLFGLGVAGYGVACGGFALLTNLYAAATEMIVLGGFNSLFAISGQTLLQTLTPSEIRGRVVAARVVVIDTALAVGAALGGGVLLVLSFRAIWLLLGAVIVAASLFVWLRPEVRDQT